VLHPAGKGHLFERADEIPNLLGRLQVADDLNLSRFVAGIFFGMYEAFALPGGAARMANLSGDADSWGIFGVFGDDVRIAREVEQFVCTDRHGGGRRLQDGNMGFGHFDIGRVSVLSGRRRSG